MDIKYLKTYHIKKIVLGYIFLVICSCNDDFLEPEELTRSIDTVDVIFQDRSLTETFLKSIYNNFPNFFTFFNSLNERTGSSLFSVYSDEIAIRDVGTEEFLSPLSNSELDVFNIYRAIRNCNIFIENIDRNNDFGNVSNPEELKQHYKGEARLLKVFYHWYLMRLFGPISIPPRTAVNANDLFVSDTSEPRSPWDDCVEFIVSELQLAKQELGPNLSVGADFGRVDRLVALALESQILLYHASPLYNAPTVLQNFQNTEGVTLLNPVFDPTRWQRAAQSTKEAIDFAESNGKSLYVTTDMSGDDFDRAFRSVRDLFWDGYEQEGLWYVPTSVLSKEEGVSLLDQYQIWSSPLVSTQNGATHYNVIQGLVDDFRTRDGLDIDNDPDYDPTVFASSETDYYALGTSGRFTNREPRFYANIFFNGAKVKALNTDDITTVELFRDGNSGSGGVTQLLTGYYPRKNVHPDFRKDASSALDKDPTRPFMFMRLSELYLNYAEALNESDPGNPDVLEYLNRVRTRAGLIAITSGSQDEIRDHIRRERRIELCFEGGHRFGDVRRWLLADQIGFNQGGDFFGMNISKGDMLSSVEFHKDTIAYTREPWQNHFYFLPYTTSILSQNSKINNPEGY